MADTKISAAPDAGMLLSTDMLPVARSGNSSAFRSSIGGVANYINAQVTTPPYGDNDTSIATTAFVQAAVAPALNDAGRNLIHNSMFNIAQRGVGPWTASGNYLADRWVQWIGTGDTINTVINGTDDVIRAAVGDEACQYVIYTTFTGASGAANFVLVQQNMEGVRRFGGKTVTLSFWAVAGKAGTKIGISIDQNFGTGGSPSASVFGNGIAVPLTTGWARYSVTLAIPSCAGKTLGTDGNAITQISFWYSAGSNYATRAGNIGVQNDGIPLWGVQLEIGSVATPLEKPDPQQDLAKCQRFYQTGMFDLNSYNIATAGISQILPFPVTMRVAPAVTAVGGGTYLNASGGTLSAWGAGSLNIGANVTATGGGRWYGTYTASADL